MINIVEIFNNGDFNGNSKFSVPDDVKKAFNKTFKGQNNSAIIASLMEQAVEETVRQERRKQAMRQILKRRKRLKPMTAEEVHETRQSLRNQ